ncbi:MAG TPA: bifunctional oligoribonuclease/PAP phosphatase NrnA [Chloroflexota bacterium]
MATPSSTEWPSLRPLFDAASNIVVTCHHSPDGDALASLLALSESLRATKHVASISPSPVPRSYRFLPGGETIAVYRGDESEGGDPEARDGLAAADLVICLDCSDLERLGPLYEENRDKLLSTPIVNIDHHISNGFYGQVNLVDPSAASVCEFLVRIMEKEGLPISRQTANVLLVGIVADTLGFRTGATSAATLRTAASLIERGASLSWASESVFNNRSAPALRLWGRVLSRAQVDGRLVWSDITREMLDECGATLADADTLVDFIAGVPGTSGAFLFSEQDGKVRVSMRTSRDLNASDLARFFGGGGHPRAAGCTLEGTIGEAERRVLAEARGRLDTLVAGRGGQREIDA